MTQPSPLESLFQAGRQITYRPREIIYRGGDTPSGIYYISSGRIKIYTLGKDGQESIALTLRAGDLLLSGWGVLGEVHEKYIEALELTTLLRISRGQFLRSCQTDTAIAFAVLQKTTQYMFMLIDRITIADRRGAHSKITSYLAAISRQESRRSSARTSVKLKVSHYHIARSVSLSRETVSRELGKLQQQGLIQKSNRSIIVPNLAAMIAAANSDLG